MGFGKHIEKMLAVMLAVVLAVGLVPTGAQAAHPAFDGDGVGTDASGAHQMTDAVSVSGESATSNVFVEVALDAFELTDRSPNWVAPDATSAIDFYKGRIWAQTQGGEAPIRAAWEVTRDGQQVGTFTPTQRADGTWGLELTHDGAAGSLHVDAPGQYDCTFTATDAQGRVVSTCITFLIEQNSPYGAKTVYKDHDETFDGVATYTEPSATGIIHKYVQHLSAIKAEPASAVYQSLMDQAHAYALSQGQAGAYAIHAAWSLETYFTFPQAGDPDPYKGNLSVVIPMPATDGAPAAGERVFVIGYDASGDKVVREVSVRADESGARYVAFDDAPLGSYAVCTYIPDGATGPTDPDDPNKPADPLTVKVTGVVEGAGFMNYEGTYTWPKVGAVRYTFTPVVPGSALAKIEVDADGVALEVPAWCRLAGYYDLNLEGLPEGTHEVTVRAIFVDTGDVVDPDPDKPRPPIVDPEDPDRPVDPDDPEDPMNKDWKLTVVTEGAGQVDISVAGATADAPYTFRKGQLIEGVAYPANATGSLLSATLETEIAGERVSVALDVTSGAFSFQGPGADAVLRVVFSDAPAPPVRAHSVVVRIEGGHGSVDVPFDGTAQTEATKPVSAASPATFALFPEAGYELYTMYEGSVDVGVYAHAQSTGYGVSVPDVGRDRLIVVRFAKVAEELPPVVVPGTFVTIDVAIEATAGLASTSLPSATPESVSVPKGAGYSFYLIPAPSADAELAYVRAKGDADTTWRDITASASWVVWPSGGAAGYWLLTLDQVSSDTHVRAGFRPRTDDDGPRDPTRTRNITINVVGSEWGAVFPNTVGKPPLKVPAGKSVVVTVVTKEGYHYEVRRADDARGQGASAEGASADAASDITLIAPTADAAGSDKTSTEIIGGAGDGDEDWEFVFGPNGGGGSSSSSSSASSSAGSSAGSSASRSAGTSAGSSGGSQGSSGGNHGGTGTIKDPSGRPTITPEVVADGAGRTHGRVIPADPFLVPLGADASVSFAADAGYRVVRVEVNGARTTAFTQTGYTLRNVRQDTTVRVTFAAYAETDGLSEPARTVHRLQSLAKTGDITPPAITLLLCIACAAGGGALLAAARRRRDADERAEAQES